MSTQASHLTENAKEQIARTLALSHAPVHSDCTEGQQVCQVEDTGPLCGVNQDGPGSSSRVAHKQGCKGKAQQLPPHFQLPGSLLSLPGQLGSVWLKAAGALGPEKPPGCPSLHPKGTRDVQQLFDPLARRNLLLGWPQCLKPG